ncbi:unnamed protein product [Moneuplotes crassus]|uniref:Protein kinase domain-containing protein n=1 Tax=Euplotes crassus TaxID=5936 RepID=A0AAD1Y7R4_EUPCR|nr:unnamed protein product [Moneuplotes crassus]
MANQLFIKRTSCIRTHKTQCKCCNGEADKECEAEDIVQGSKHETSRKCPQTKITRKYVGSLIANRKTSRNHLNCATNLSKTKEERKECNKGVLLRRSLAQTPPLFKKEQEKEESGCILDVNKSFKKPMIVQIGSNPAVSRYGRVDKQLIPKVTPKNNDSMKESHRIFKAKSLKNKPQSAYRNKGKPLNSYLLIQTSESIADSVSIKTKAQAKVEGRMESRLIKNTQGSGSTSQNSANNKLLYIESSNSGVPMSYRVNNESSITPYTQPTQNRQLSGEKRGNLINKRIMTSHSRTRPMSYTFHYPSKNTSHRPYQNRIVGSHKIKESTRYTNITRPNSRRARLKEASGEVSRRVKRAETVTPCTKITIPDSKMKLRKEFNDMNSLKYHISHDKIDKEYIITSTVLGTGSYAVVKLGESIPPPGDMPVQVAIKIYEKNKLFTNKHRRLNLYNEITVLKSLKHPNVIKLIKVFEDRSKIYLVLEYVKGVSLYKYIKEKSHRLKEKEANFIFKEILKTLTYIHKNGIAHRDVKLDNILVTNEKLDPNNFELPAKHIKAIDFGFAVKYDKGDKSNTYCGTPSYMAPEIIKRVEFDYEKGDVWALGVVLYALMCGKFPFKGITNKELYKNIVKGEYNTPKHFTMDTKRLLCKMLEPDFKKRKSFSDLSKDDFITSSISGSVMDELKRRNYQLKKVYTKTKGKILGKIKEKAASP